MTESALERVEACLAQIDARDQELTTFITVTADAAREQAAAADAAAADGRWLGLLHGMPIALKDNIDTAGVRTTSGAKFWSERVPNDDAAVVQRLKAAGAVMVGKATLGELVFDVRSHNPIVGHAKNPWNLTRSPGGSSGGSAAAIAADMCVGALGSDTGGSVRIPASFCGVSGLRPTHGAVPSTGATPVSVGNDTVGPMARRAEDVARLFAVMVGYEPSDPHSIDHDFGNFLPRLNDGVEGLRIGIPQNFFFDNVDADIEAAVRAGAQVFEQLGAELVPIELPGAHETFAQVCIQIYCDVAHFHRQRLADDRDSFSAPIYERMCRGLEISGVEYAGAMRFKEQWMRTVGEAFDDVDVILSPTSPVPALALEDSPDLHALTARAASLTYAGSLASIPGLSLPCGFTENGLPVGMLLQSAWWDDPLLLRAGCAYQSVTDWHERRPG
ncbi:MAG: aspartyl-tRNA(Asn)/glutamyl-tRNA(Gln) amidotransferase subunit A [Gammaproteobacteria bacterium]|jgi:aspartyl-tRNA(Asn)/glutamyl-tRNA(Gln) amidotransferase subunit A